MNNYLLGFELLIIGMGTVFLSLYLLSIFLYFSGRIFASDKKEEIKKPKKIKNVKKTEIKKNLDSAQHTISSKKIAAVTAAVAEYLNSEKEYRIISIKKSTKNWKR